MGTIPCQPWGEERGEMSSCWEAGDKPLPQPLSVHAAIAAVPTERSAPLKVFSLHSDQVECKVGKKTCEHVHSRAVYVGRREAIWKLKLCQDDSLEILL